MSLGTDDLKIKLEVLNEAKKKLDDVIEDIREVVEGTSAEKCAEFYLIGILKIALESKNFGGFVDIENKIRRDLEDLEEEEIEGR